MNWIEWLGRICRYVDTIHSVRAYATWHECGRQGEFTNSNSMTVPIILKMARLAWYGLWMFSSWQLPETLTTHESLRIGDILTCNFRPYVSVIWIKIESKSTPFYPQRFKCGSVSFHLLSPLRFQHFRNSEHFAKICRMCDQGGIGLYLSRPIRSLWPWLMDRCWHVS